MTARLSRLSQKELEFLRAAIKRRQIGTPVTELALKSIGKEKLFARLGPLAGAGEEAALAIIEVLLAGGERAADAPAAAAAAELLWTGPEVPASRARPTTAVLLELFAAARTGVLLAGYEFDHGAVLFEPLFRAMVERGVKVALYLDVRPAPSPRTKMDAYLAVEAHRFVERNWPFGEPVPELYYFPEGCEHGSRRSLHAKCVVVDRRHVLVGSANFTRRGHTRNLEVGVRLDDAELAASLAAQFERLVGRGELVRMPAALAPRGGPPAAAEDEEEAAAPEAAASGEALYRKLADDLLVSVEVRPLFARLLAAGLPAPEVGEDIEGDGGEVIGTAELSWPDARVAVLLSEQAGAAERLQAAGWYCVSLPTEGALGAEDFEALRARVGRED